MELDDHDFRLIAALADGLPLVAEPYAALGEKIGMAESEVLSRLENMLGSGTIKRFGVVVRHHELGYRSNAMSVWDIPDAEVDAVGEKLAPIPAVTLCYRRVRRPPDWNYNLFCMIHGRDRKTVEAEIARLNAEFGLARYPHQVLFSTKRFKQRGARYGKVA
jgi:DNA-binding Lrp family transcriptional regulator